MDPLTLGLLFGGGGLLKSELIDAPRAAKERQLAAATQAYSPWTGLKAQPVHEPDPAGSALQFGATGAALGQSSEMNDAMKGWLSRNGWRGNVNMNFGQGTPFTYPSALGNIGG